MLGVCWLLVGCTSARSGQLCAEQAHAPKMRQEAHCIYLPAQGSPNHHALNTALRYAVEAGLKITAMGLKAYWAEYWNQLDLVSV